MPAEAVLYVDALEPVAAFYRDCLAMRQADAGIGYSSLRSDDLVLWLVKPRNSAGGGEGERATQRRSQVPVKLGFVVESIERAAESIERSGGQIDEATWDFGGYRRRDAVDLEGNVIQLLEALSA